MDRRIEKEYERLKKKLVNCYCYFSNFLRLREFLDEVLDGLGTDPRDTDSTSEIKEVKEFYNELADIDEEMEYKFLDKIEKIKQDLCEKVWEDIERNALEEFDRISEFEPIRDKLRRRAEELCSE